MCIIKKVGKFVVFDFFNKPLGKGKDFLTEPRLNLDGVKKTSFWLIATKVARVLGDYLEIYQRQNHG